MYSTLVITLSQNPTTQLGDGFYLLDKEELCVFYRNFCLVACRKGICSGWRHNISCIHAQKITLEVAADVMSFKLRCVFSEYSNHSWLCFVFLSQAMFLNF